MAAILNQHVEGNIDLLKVVTMLLIHDLVEIDAGDTWLYAAEKEGAVEMEENAARRVFGMLSAEQESEFIDLWSEFEAKTSAEAKLASMIDAI
jgi:putative hydrolase of HD superfamily